MFITQSAASQSVKNLEEALGVKLFCGGKREIALTAEGEMLYEYVKNALSLLERAEGELHRFKKLERARAGLQSAIPCPAIFCCRF